MSLVRRAICSGVRAMPGRRLYWLAKVTPAAMLLWAVWSLIKDKNPSGKNDAEAFW